MRTKIVCLQKTDVVAGDDGCASCCRQYNCLLHIVLFSAASGTRELQVKALAEYLLPLLQPVGSLLRVSGDECAANVPVHAAGEGNELVAGVSG